MHTLIERIRNVFGEDCKIISNDDISTKYSGWFINGAVLWEEHPLINKNEIGTIEDVPVFFYAENLLGINLLSRDFLQDSFKNKIIRQVKGKYLRNIMDFVDLQSSVLQNDLIRIHKTSPPKGVDVLGKKHRIFIDKSASVFPGTILDAREGNIYIARGASITPPSLIEGPCYIGDHVLIDSAKIRNGNSFFSGCKVSGEVEASIFSEYVNKHHDGFIGHSYIGSFVNFGAMSTNSDLKNNYRPVKVFLNQQWTDAHSIKMGVFVGDHTKFGIGSLLNSGTVVGIGCNLYTNGGFYPKFIPSFSWGSGYPFKKYRLEEFIQNTESIMQRREKTLEHKEIKVITSIYNSIKDFQYEKF